ncbi:GNAT family N-acetyltransferase [uncultured Enterococcus sp.]|uniref:GNAT family N-acetyltransferase n=1 Tax=uncultured Enterococcus sp. TaxID=167972 RepID=UPI0028E88DD7|nr:GNAT family N-acetyltransferase [uncultured Enterococcus sp.]
MTQVKIKFSQDETLLATFHKEIQTQHHQWYPTIFKPFDQSRFEQAITQQLQEPSHHFFIAWLADQPCGFVHLQEVCLPQNAMMHERKWLEIAAIAVDPRYQGMHIGKQLLAFAENVALERGFDDLSLNFWSANQVKSFYEQAGFVSIRQGASKHLR